MLLMLEATTHTSSRKLQAPCTGPRYHASSLCWSKFRNFHRCLDHDVFLDPYPHSCWYAGFEGSAPVARTEQSRVNIADGLTQ